MSILKDLKNYFDLKDIPFFEKFLNPEETEPPTTTNEVKKFLQIADEAFHTDMLFHEKIDPNGDYLRETIEKMLIKYNKNPENYYAPFTAIIQSSGMGKTRMLENLSKKDGVCVVYCNLNDPDKNSFPPRTKIFANYLLEQDLKRKDLEKRVYTYFKEFINYIDSYKNPNDPNKKESQIFSFKNDDQTSKLNVWKNIEKNDQNCEETIERKTKIMIVFAFDEARSLIYHTTKEGKVVISYL